MSATDPAPEPEVDRRTKLGAILDALGVQGSLSQNDRITDVLVVAKVQNLVTGNVALMVEANGIDWIAQQGLCTALADAFASGYYSGRAGRVVCDDDDD